jgi:hypothetical protein
MSRALGWNMSYSLLREDWTGVIWKIAGGVVIGKCEGKAGAVEDGSRCLPAGSEYSGSM